MKLQLAFDRISKEDALELLSNIHETIDVLEIGTPMIYRYGVDIIGEMRKFLPDTEIFADTKIMDAGATIAEMALNQGADYITVLALTDRSTVQTCVDLADRYHAKVVADLIGVQDFKECLQRLRDAGCTSYAVHTGKDRQDAGATPLEDLKQVSGIAQVGDEIFVAGGIDSRTLDAYLTVGPDIVIVGGAILKSDSPVRACGEFYRRIHAC